MSKSPSLLLRYWNEMPDIFGSSFMALIGAGFGIIGLINYYSKDGDNRRYKLDYTVYRHDDLRICQIKDIDPELCDAAKKAFEETAASISKECSSCRARKPKLL